MALATHDQLQLWSINAALLAVRACARSRSSRPHLPERFDCPGVGLQVSDARVPPIRCMALTPTPEWMVESLPVMASGHEDGTVRWWVVREPHSSGRQSGSWLPYAKSAVPVGGALQPAWELAERCELRLRTPERAPITSLCMSEGGGTRLLWTGDARGEVRSWAVPGEGGDYFTPLAERY